MKKQLKLTSLSLLPPESREGDVLDITIVKDAQETENAKERVSALLEKLKSKNLG